MPNKRKPDNIHLLEGTFQPCRHGDPDKKAKVADKLGPAPDSLNDIARAEWNKKGRMLEKAGLLSGVDETIFAQYCMLYAEFSEQGYDFPGTKHTQLRLCQMELGMTPASRSKITVKTDDDDDEF